MCSSLHVAVEAAAWDRVVGVQGGIVKPSFGLSAAGYDELPRAFDTVFQFAARNKFLSVLCLLSHTCPLHVGVSFQSVMK